MLKKLSLAAYAIFACVSNCLAIALGVYDENQTFTTSSYMAYEHIYLSSWCTPNTLYPQATGSTLTAALLTIQKRGRWPLVTVQPFHSSSIGTAQSLLSDVAAGKYDTVIASVCAQIRAYNGPIVIRWGHEMDLPANIGRYDWATSNAALYVAAYRHAISVFAKDLAGQASVYYVWCPSGQPDCNNYYPGNSYCQLTGCEIYSWSVGDTYFGITNYSFSGLFGSVYGLLSVHNKDILICECGVDSSDPQQAWVSAAFAAFPTYPLLSGVVYFNSVDSVPWWTNGPIPNWSISPSIWQ
jgi:beta-mannanase